MLQFATIVTNQFQLEELPYKVLLGLFLRKCCVVVVVVLNF